MNNTIIRFENVTKSYNDGTVVLKNINLTINDGDRIAQMVIAKFEKVEWNEVEELNETERGDGGFGHTGKK